jgi:protein-arginine kinase activator protein McsA
MFDAAARKEYEVAAQIRDKIQRIMKQALEASEDGE